MNKVGIIREGKTPPDKRVPLVPYQCKQLLKDYPDVELFVQPSDVRAIPESQYEKAGAIIREDLSNCDLLIGVKEVPEEDLIPGKTYMFFSHTFKKQPYNRSLLRTILEKKISLIDYEVLTTDKGVRILGFGRYAGIVGAYNTLRAVGIKWGLYDLKPAHTCDGIGEVHEELKKVVLPDHFKVVLTGKGRVAGGALEILNRIAIRKVSSEAYLTNSFDEPVFCQLSVSEYNKKADGSSFKKAEFYKNPEGFESDFMKYARVSDVYIPCHYWDARAPFIFTREDAKKNDFKIKLVGDISCDIDGPVASTLRPSTIEDPLYGYDPTTETEVDFMDPDAIGVMAVDNLPCELPKDASEDFGKELLQNVFPELLSGKRSSIIERARQTNLQGELTVQYAYLQDYVDGKE
jgi:alanine dehydrogenase